MENKYFKIVPLLLSSSYAGIMAYIAFLDPKSRQHLEPRERLIQWTGMFKTAYWPMFAYSVATGFSGFLQYYITKNINWAIGGGFITAILPFTGFIIKPVYAKLLDANQKGDTKNSDSDINTWTQLHKVRVLLATIATGFFVYALLQDETPKLVLK